MSRYAWVVTRDYLENKTVEVVGPRGATEAQVAELKAKKGTPFKMYDADGDLYYSGYLIGDFEGMEPLDDYGTPNAGATEIRMIGRSGKWEAL